MACGVRRTLERRIRTWRALQGAEQDVISSGRSTRRVGLGYPISPTCAVAASAWPAPRSNCAISNGGTRKSAQTADLRSQFQQKGTLARFTGFTQDEAPLYRGARRRRSQPHLELEMKELIISQSELQTLAQYSGDPWNSKNRYFIDAEPHIISQWKGLIFPFLAGSDFRSVVDLAAGHGRNSSMIVSLPELEHLWIIDIQSANVEKCRERFSGYHNISFAVNNGYDLRPVPAGTVTLIYCFDAMVHFDSDVVRSYLRDAHRVLAPGGRAFFHHSNYTGGHDWRKNPGSRNFMSRELMAHYAFKEGLSVLRQTPLDWSGQALLDCITLLEKPADQKIELGSYRLVPA